MSFSPPALCSFKKVSPEARFGVFLTFHTVLFSHCRHLSAIRLAGLSAIRLAGLSADLSGGAQAESEALAKEDDNAKYLIVNRKSKIVN